MRLRNQKRDSENEDSDGEDHLLSIPDSTKVVASIYEFNSSWIPFLHSLLAFGAFIVAFVASYFTKWHHVIKNEWYGYPDEWFPSVSAVTGDFYPARNCFQIMIALTAGPRFGLVFLNYLMHLPKTSWSTYGKLISNTSLIFGLIRTVAAGVWIYITSSDAHLVHDVGMIVYLVFGLFYMISLTLLSKWTGRHAKSPKYRIYAILGFLSVLPFLVYWFIQHKVHRIPGAYSIYAYFEWSLILFDVGFDAVSSLELRSSRISVTTADDKFISPTSKVGLVTPTKKRYTA